MTDLAHLIAPDGGTLTNTEKLTLSEMFNGLSWLSVVAKSDVDLTLINLWHAENINIGSGKVDQIRFSGRKIIKYVYTVMYTSKMLNQQTRKSVDTLKRILNGTVITASVHQFDASEANADQRATAVSNEIRKLVRLSSHDIVIAVMEVK